jgi:hypothetical protein
MLVSWSELQQEEARWYALFVIFSAGVQQQASWSAARIVALAFSFFF